MRLSVPACLVATFVIPLVARPGLAQSVAASQVPRFVTLTGVYRPADGRPPGSVELVTLSIYKDQEGGVPVWQEQQTVTLDDRGRYTVILGASRPDGIPGDVFASGAQWLGTLFERLGEVEGARVRITSAPYALKAADADTLGGHPASAYVLAPTGSTSEVTAKPSSANATTSPPANLVNGGTTNAVAKYVSSTDVGPSAITEVNGAVGVGTTIPLDLIHVRFANTTGGLTGFAVQNLGNTATSYSGMLFYDQNGALGQFQGFNNGTHEYRINNIAKTAGNFDGSINFMVGSASKFFVNSSGRIGIGTTTPQYQLEVDDPSNAGLRVATGIAGGTVASFASNGVFTIDAPFQPGGRFYVGEDGHVSVGVGGGTVYRLAVVEPSTYGLLVNIDSTGGRVAEFGTKGDFEIDGLFAGDRFIVKESGLTGIGTNHPSYKLHVSDPSNTGLRVETGTTGGSVASFGGSGDFQIDAPGVIGGRFVVKESGLTGIGIDSPASLLDVNGILTLRNLGSAGATALCRNAGNQISTCSSSLRYKTNVTDFQGGLSLINRLRPIAFDWKADGEADLGLAAEEVAKVEPLLVIHNEKGEVEGVKYDRINVLLINAIKEQQAEIEAQQATNVRQQADIVALKKLVCADHPTAAVCRSN
jgi:hypothetical protein